MKHNMIKIIGVFLVISLMLIGCSKSMERKDYSSPQGVEDSADGDSGSDAGVNKETINAVPDNGRKMIRSIDLTIETKEFEKLSGEITKKTTQLNGYIEKSDIRGNTYNENSNRNGSYIVRIPKAKLDEFLNAISGHGNILNQQESVDDVTNQYTDIESHKKSLLIQQERLLALLAEANRLDDIITLENRLNDVRYQIESYETKIRSYDNLVEYSTVSIQISEVDRIIKVDDGTMFSKMTTGFQRSARDIGTGLQNFAIWVVTNILYLVIWAAIIFGAYLIIKKLVKKERAKIKQTLQPQPQYPHNYMQPNVPQDNQQNAQNQNNKPLS